MFEGRSPPLVPGKDNVTQNKENTRSIPPEGIQKIILMWIQNMQYHDISVQMKFPTSSSKLLTLIDEAQQQVKYVCAAFFSWHFP